MCCNTAGPKVYKKKSQRSTNGYGDALELKIMNKLTKDNNKVDANDLIWIIFHK